jgi:hypothetical protein
MAARKRKQIYVDGSVQGALVVRAGIYWLFCILSIVTFTACWIVLTERPANSLELFSRLRTGYAPAFLASLIMLPIVLLDIVRFSNRFAGPLYRIRSTVKAMADGHSTAPVKLREADFWKDFADDFNRLAQRVKQLESGAEPSVEEEVHETCA